MRQLKIARRSLSEAAAKTMAHTFIISRIDYCNSVLHGVSAVHLRPLQNVVNPATRIIQRKQRHDHITAHIRDLLQWLPVQQRVEYGIRPTRPMQVSLGRYLSSRRNTVLFRFVCVHVSVSMRPSGVLVLSARWRPSTTRAHLLRGRYLVAALTCHFVPYINGY